MGYSIDALEENCYPGTTILINRFDIRNGAKLAEVENVIVSAQSTKWLNAPPCAAFDFDHYKAIHAYLFSAIYDWAGTVRTVDISKKGTYFCRASEIEAQARLTFGRLKKYNCFRGFTRSDYIDELVDFYHMTNMLHPFREGNGRTQRLFLQQLIRSAGYDINWSRIDPDLLMIATIQAAHGVIDLLRAVFNEQLIQSSIKN